MQKEPKATATRSPKGVYSCHGIAGEGLGIGGAVAFVLFEKLREINLEGAGVNNASVGWEVGLRDGTGDAVGMELMLGWCETEGSCVGMELMLGWSEIEGVKLSVGSTETVGIGDDVGSGVAIVGTDGAVVEVGRAVVGATEPGGLGATLVGATEGWWENVGLGVG